MSWKDNVQAWNHPVTVVSTWEHPAVFFHTLYGLNISNTLRSNGWQRTNKVPYNDWGPNQPLVRNRGW